MKTRTLLAIVKTSVSVQLESVKARVTVPVGRTVFYRALGMLQTGGDSGTMFATWSFCLKFSSR